jgi:putative addiction module killer protein
MSEWTVDLEPIERWLSERTPTEKAALARRLRLLEALGNQLGMPNVKNLGAGLFELREMGFGFRIYFYFSKENQRIIITLVGGNKSSQSRDIKRARELMK